MFDNDYEHQCNIFSQVQQNENLAETVIYYDLVWGKLMADTYQEMLHPNFYDSWELLYIPILIILDKFECVRRATRFLQFRVWP